MSSHIYLLSHRSGGRFKIGKANDIIERARCFGLSELDWSGSAGYVVESVSAALRLERILLRAFEGSRLTPKEVLEDGGGIDGATEWMRSACRERVEEFLQHLSDLIPHERVCGDRLEQQVNALLAPIRQAMAERALRLEQKRQRDVIRDETRRAQASESRAVLERELSRAGEAFWHELERHASMGTIVGMSTSNYGWNLVLLQEGCIGRVWQADFKEAAFTWPGGAGGLFNSVWEFGDCDARVCIVGLGRCLSAAWPSRTITAKCLDPVVRFLRSLEEVECDQLQSTAWGEFLDERNEALDQHRRRVLDMFLDEHVPKLQARRAAAMTASLFDIEVVSP